MNKRKLGNSGLEVSANSRRASPLRYNSAPDGPTTSTAVRSDSKVAARARASAIPGALLRSNTRAAAAALANPTAAIPGNPRVPPPAAINTAAATKARARIQTGRDAVGSVRKLAL